jgi:hypothetical protein
MIAEVEQIAFELGVRRGSRRTKRRLTRLTNKQRTQNRCPSWSFQMRWSVEGMEAPK